MLAVLSPAKSLDFETPTPYDLATQPVFQEEADYLINKLQKLSKKKISNLMSISDNLSELNYQRYKEWNSKENKKISKPAIYAFTGDVYQGFDVATMNKADVEYAQNHIRILSGLYGLLKPLDTIQPYRLEMGTKLNITKAKTNLYKYWDKQITHQLNEDLNGFTPKVLVNLASNEYFKAVQPKHFDGEVIDCAFKDYKDGKLKLISFFAKKARGMMAAYMVKERIQSIEGLKGFNYDGYGFDPKLSSEKELVFTR